MKKKTMEAILRRIRKNAERGAGRPSDRGMYEAAVPEKLIKREAKSN